MNLDSMCIEQGLNPLPFHGKFEADFWESVCQSNKTVNTHFDSEDLEMSSVYKDGTEKEPFSEGVSEKIFYSTI